jgi:hypothetical protein
VSPHKRLQKRVNTGNEKGVAEEENEDVITVESTQRPRRTVIPTRRALEAISANTHLRPQTGKETNE